MKKTHNSGAVIYARFSDPRIAQGGQQPPYFAGQFYGSGSVFYLGSGEMWRLRAVDVRGAATDVRGR